MQRTIKTLSIENNPNCKENLLIWAQQFDTAIWLDSNNYKQQYTSFQAALAVDEFTAIKTDFTNAFDKLKEYQSVTKDYIFGYLSYDLKNDVEQLSSSNFDGLRFADLYFFQPQKLIFIKNKTIEFHYLPLVDDEIEKDFNAIIHNVNSSKSNNLALENSLDIKARISKKEYLQKINKMLDHIKRGDIYEANFCQEFYVENTEIDPLTIYNNLNAISEPPFAVFLKIEHQYLLSASPERYLRKRGGKIISQPIKGTAKRLPNTNEDLKSALRLERDIKEQSENVMIVDLVRNDLSKSAKKGSVRVEELCKIYSFKQVHQMISTVVSDIKEETHAITVLKDTFPMGSMTGAPKVSAMNIIESLEETKRGLYSGAVGYFTPNGDFDFNVVIRSILYNQKQHYTSYSVGSAITSKSIPENEYQECLLKAAAMRYVLSNAK